MINTLIRDSIVIKEIKKCMDSALGELFGNEDFLELDHLCEVDTERDSSEFKYYLEYFKNEVQNNILLNQTNTYFFRDILSREIEDEDSITLKTLLHEDENEILSLEVKIDGIEQIKKGVIYDIRVFKELKKKDTTIEYMFSSYPNHERNGLIINVSSFSNVFNTVSIAFSRNNEFNITQSSMDQQYIKDFSKKEFFSEDEKKLKSVFDFLNLFKPFTFFDNNKKIIPQEINDILFNGANIDDSLIDNLSIAYDIDLKDIKKYSDFLIDVKKFNCENIKTAKNIIKVKG